MLVGCLVCTEECIFPSLSLQDKNSVPGLAYVVVNNRAEMLRAGNSEGALADLNDTSIVVKKRRAGNKKNGKKKNGNKM
jgi:hypothetical protein